MATKPKDVVPGNAVPPRPAPVADADRKYALKVKARVRMHYGQIREEEEEFDNTLDLSTYPEDEHSNIEAVQD